jgi:hypothetical protein
MFMRLLLCLDCLSPASCRPACCPARLPLVVPPSPSQAAATPAQLLQQQTAWATAAGSPATGAAAAQQPANTRWGSGDVCSNQAAPGVQRGPACAFAAHPATPCTHMGPVAAAQQGGCGQVAVVWGVSGQGCVLQQLQCCPAWAAHGAAADMLTTPTSRSRAAVWQQHQAKQHAGRVWGEGVCCPGIVPGACAAAAAACLPGFSARGAIHSAALRGPRAAAGQQQQVVAKGLFQTVGSGRSPGTSHAAAGTRRA